MKNVLGNAIVCVPIVCAVMALPGNAAADCPAVFTNLGFNGDTFPGGIAPGLTGITSAIKCLKSIVPPPKSLAVKRIR